VRKPKPLLEFEGSHQFDARLKPEIKLGIKEGMMEMWLETRHLWLSSMQYLHDVTEDLLRDMKKLQSFAMAHMR